MLAHLERRHTFLEQEMQEESSQETPQLESISFEELKDSKTLHSEQGEGQDCLALTFNEASFQNYRDAFRTVHLSSNEVLLYQTIPV